MTHKFTCQRCAAGSLELFEADLLTDGSFDAAVKGAHYVFHAASPFFIKVSSLHNGAASLILSVLSPVCA